MCSRMLSNFNSYIGKLEIYARASHIKVEYSQTCTDIAAYIPKLRKIVIDDSLSDAEIIAVFLHELGHAHDENLRDNKCFNSKLDSATVRYHKGYKCTKNQFKLIMTCEKAAWKYAKGIAKLLKIPLGKWFYKVKSDCLRSYYENP